MGQALLEEEKLKSLVKSALVEALEERKGVLRELIEETMEDIALARAIKEGERTRKARRKQVFAVLEGER